MRVLLVPLALLVALSAPAIAEHCTEPTSDEAELTTCVGGVEPCFYVDNDSCQPECTFSLWIYQESNGYPGLQRGDEMEDGTCHGMVEPDTIVF